MYKYNYVVIPNNWNKCKIGLWNSTISDLISRYKTYYGNDLEIYVFQCEDNNQNEKMLKIYFQQYNLSGELFDVSILNEILDVCASTSFNYCKSLDMETRFKRILALKKQKSDKIIPFFIKTVKIPKTSIDFKKIFKRVLQELLKSTNSISKKYDKMLKNEPLFKYLTLYTRYKEDNVFLLEDMRNNFSEWLGKSVRSLDNGTFYQVNKDYLIEQIITCKYCNKIHKKGCCDKYTRTGRSTKKIIKNLELMLVDIPE